MLTVILLSLEFLLGGFAITAEAEMENENKKTRASNVVSLRFIL